ncbi:MAG: hypothetical protein H0X59_01840, partial [Chloroflexi bacterium]|nr:hypothetical protein [Chloroflexota bacterium]
MAAPRSTRRRARSGSSERASHRSPPRRRAAAESGSGSWARRIGIALGLLAVGGTIVLAGSGALDEGERASTPPGASTRPGASARAPASPSSAPITASPSTRIPAPTLEGAATAATRGREWQITVAIPADLPERRQTRLLVHRGDEIVAEAPVRSRDEVTVEGIPLRRGENRFTATLRGPSGEGPPSAELVVTRDEVVPEISLSEPLSGAKVHSEQLTLMGDTEPGAQLMISNATNERTSPAVVAADGTFQGEIALVLGSNELTLTATDQAGNVDSTELTVVRREGVDEARLILSQTTFPVRRLPASISLRVLVVDAEGETVDGAE